MMHSTPSPIIDPSALSLTAEFTVTPVQAAQVLLRQLLKSSIMLEEDWEALPDSVREELSAIRDKEVLLRQLVENKLLTEFQAVRIRSGASYGLILGSYRVLDRLGSGGMGAVFKCEHLRMRRLAAIKVVRVSSAQDSRLQVRFFSEMRAVAQLTHPNIIGAIDCGEMASVPDGTGMQYLVMEYVPGQDLQAYVEENGRLPIPQACQVMYQVAIALDVIHQHGLVHRDIKPSNIMITPEGQTKLLDFGLVRHFRTHVTEFGVTLGTIGFMAPEQICDASNVDIRADLFGLGGCLFWCLTGMDPFPSQGSAQEDLARRLSQMPADLRALRPEVPPELAAVVARLLALDPDDRYLTPQAVLRSLRTFVPSSSSDSLRAQTALGNGLPAKAQPADGKKVHRILLVDDDPHIRMMCRFALQSEELLCEEAANGKEALAALKSHRHDLVLLDLEMPELSGWEVLRQLGERQATPHLKVLLTSGSAAPDAMAEQLLIRADDYLLKPLSVVQLRSRVQAALRLRDLQSHSDRLSRQLLTFNGELERNLSARENDLVHARNALVLTLAELVGYRTLETGVHLLRVQRYSRTLAEEAANLAVFSAHIDWNFIQMLETCAPLHDIGKMALPDQVLTPSFQQSTAEETIIRQTHTTVGSDIFRKVASRHGSGMGFLQMAIDIIRHHHERFDGSGYPDHLAGTAIPLAARIVAIADVYDALRCHRLPRPALPHASALKVILEASPGQFDPSLLQALKRCATNFERIFAELPNSNQF